MSLYLQPFKIFRIGKGSSIYLSLKKEDCSLKKTSSFNSLSNDIVKVWIKLTCAYYFHISLREEITEFAENLLDWLDESLTEVPLALKEAKFEG